MFYIYYKISMDSTIFAFTITKPIGVSGLLKARSFIDISNFQIYKPYFDETGQYIDITSATDVGGGFVKLAIDEVTTRNDAEKWRGRDILFSKSKLPKPPESEFYMVDIIGSNITYNSETIGRVESINDFGGGTLLNIRLLAGYEVYVPFTSECFPSNEIPLVVSEFGYKSYIKIGEKE